MTKTAAGRAKTYDRLRRDAVSCTRCDLYRDAIQLVFGEGDLDARLMLLGEVPGDQEDKQGHPFVGPAGRLLDKALEEAGIDRDRTYLTNAVKHFKFTPSERGKRRLHKTPNHTEIVACRPWLEAELDLVRPELVLCLGAVAAKAMLGQSFRVTQERGKSLTASEIEFSGVVMATVHPAAVLRADDRAEAYRAFLADLRTVGKALRI